jgi:hypothetical protein
MPPEKPLGWNGAASGERVWERLGGGLGWVVAGTGVGHGEGQSWGPGEGERGWEAERAILANRSAAVASGLPPVYCLLFTSTVLARAIPSYVMQPRINSWRNFPKVLCSCDGLFYLIVLKPTTSQLCKITAVGDINMFNVKYIYFILLYAFLFWTGLAVTDLHFLPCLGLDSCFRSLAQWFMVHQPLFLHLF